MGRKCCIGIIAVCISIFTINVFAQYHLSYDYVMDLARASLARGDYNDALHYFQIALILRPDKEEPLFYINIIKRAREGATRIIAPPVSTLPSLKQPVETEKEAVPTRKVKSKEERIKEVLDFLERSSAPARPEGAEGGLSERKAVQLHPSTTEEVSGREEQVKRALSEMEESLARRREKISRPVLKTEEKVEEEELALKPPLRGREKYHPAVSGRKKEVSREEKVSPVPSREKRGKIRTLYLTDELFAVQPGTKVEIEIGTSLIIEGKSIKRFLVVTPGFIKVTRLDDKRVRIDAEHIGSTFLHIWEENRRWTFNITVVPPSIPESQRIKRERSLYEVEPFKLYYSANWSSYYRGRRLGTMDRYSLSLSQWVGIGGDTPYGYFDTSARVAKFGSKTEVTNYTVGLSNAKIWNFSDFDIRGFDVYKRFSPLSYPGQLIEGFSLDASAFNKKIRYSLLWGKEREGTFGFITPGVLAERNSYVEGVRLQLFPSGGWDIAFNYARGYGTGREDYLKDKVYSLEISRNRVKDKVRTHFDSEFAYDEDSVAATLSSGIHFGKTDLTFAFRDIEKNFTTLTGRPPDRGEIGAIFGFNMPIGDRKHLSGHLDIYRDRFLFNEDKKNKLNFSSNFNFSTPLGSTSSFSTSVTYQNTPQESFPRRYLSISNSYSRNFNFWNRRISTFMTLCYQKSRNPLSLASDYDAYTLSSGFRFPVTDNLSYYLDYDYTWLKERIDGSRSNPSVMEMGIDYNKQVTANLDSNFRLYYRNEEETTSTHSFLSGQDSIEGDINFTYHPSKDLQFFVDGSVRNVWAEAAGVDKYIEASIRFGLRGTWDFPFRWNPVGIVSGYVFKDTNSNGKDDGEPRLKDIKIIVGGKELVTDENGEFSTRVRAKKVRVKVETASLPEGYVFTTPSVVERDIINGKTIKIHFGITSSASIYGVVFYDVNGNGKFDRGEPTINGVKIIVNKKSKVSSGQGTYYFRGLPEGKYTVMFDVNSIPMDYLPAVPVKKEINLSEGVNYIYNIPLRKK